MSVLKKPVLIDLVKAIFANAFSWPIAQSTTKISIGIFYLHLSSLRKFRISVYVIIVVVSVWCFEEVLANLLLCKPIDYIWDKSLDGHCVNVVAHSLASAAFNLFTDISILILPIPVLWRLRLVIKDKAGLFLIFGFGSCICVISAVRLKVLVPGSTQNGEFYHNGLSVLFTILEDSLAVTYACFIVVRPLFEGSPRSINSSSDKPRTQTNSNNNVTTRRNKVRISAPSGFVHVNGHSIMSFENLEPCKNATNLEARSITGQDWTSDDEEISIEQIAKY